MADFNLGRIRFVWKGAWQAATAFVRDDVVSFGGSSYVCVTAHTSASTFAENAAKFELMAGGGTVTTTLGDMIYRDGSSEVRLPIGTSGQALLVDNGIPAWTGLAEAANVYYVSEDGSDANDGLNLNKAFASIAHACTVVTGPAVINIKTGVYTEILPIVVPASVTIQGDGQRIAKIRPVNVVSTGADVIATNGADTATTIICNNAATTGTQFKIGAEVTGTDISGTVTITAITNNVPLSGFVTLTVSFSSQTVAAHSATVASDYSGSIMFQLSDAAMLNKLLMEGMTGFAPSGGDPENIAAATIGGVFVALNPASPIATKSPYVVECSSISTGGIGAVIDGSVHASGNKSIVFHAYTCINDGGVGFWVNGEGKSEMVSCFTYFCWFGYATTAGGRIRSLSGNNSYGKYGAVSRGFDAAEVTNDGAVYGEQLEYDGNSLVGEFVVGQTISNGASASGTITNVQTASDKIYYISTGGTFAVGDTVTSGGNSAVIAADGVTGQKGFVLVANGFSAEPRPGGSIEFATGDTGTYVIQSVGNTYVNSSSVMFIVLAGEKVTASADSTVIRIRYAYSQSRLTGHDFLSIGTGGTGTTNYPGEPTQAASQANEVIEALPGRVFYVSTDQDGNFRVGDYFRVDQATGRATLNASAFDLSGLTSLRLGSIGAQLGELVNEFSSDDTLSGNSNVAVPTEAAVRGYFGQVATDILPLTDNTQSLGSPSKRWQELFVGPGSIYVGGIKISDVNGAFTVTTAADTDSNLRVSGELQGPTTFYIDPAALGDNTGTVVIRGSLQVDGTTTTINSTTVEVVDKNIVLGYGATADSQNNGAGITVSRPDSTDAGISWDETADRWNITNALSVAGTVAMTGALTYGGVTLANAVTGTGNMVLSTSPTLTTPALGTPASGVVTNLTGTAAININGTVGATTPATGNFTALTENASPVVVQTDIGTAPNEIPLNQYLGNLAYQDAANIAGNVGVGTSLVVGTDAVIGGNTLVGGTATRSSTAGTRLVNLFNGTAPVGTLTSGVSLYSASGDFNFMDAVGGAYRVGYRNVPPVGTKTASYTLTTSDVGKYVQVGTSGSITIPNATFAEGDVVSVFNNTGAGITITCSIATAYIGGTDADKATVTVETRGVATVLFISGTVCVITGNVI